MEESTLFWQKPIGLIIRWVLFIPVGILLSAIANGIVLFIYSWIGSLSTNWMLFIYLLFGSFVLMLLFLLYLAGYFTAKIIPIRKVGNPIITVILIITYSSKIIEYCMKNSDEIFMPKGLYVILEIIFLILFFIGLWSSDN